MELSIYRFKIKSNDYFKYVCFFNNNCINDNKRFSIENLEHIYCANENFYAFDVQYGLFDNLTEDGIKYIDGLFNMIYKYENHKKYLNKKYWNKYNVYNHYFTENDLMGFRQNDITTKYKKNDFEFIKSLDEVKNIVKRYNLYLQILKTQTNKIIDANTNIKNDSGLIDLKNMAISLGLNNDYSLKEVWEYPILTNAFEEFIGITTNPNYETEILIDFLEIIFFLNPSIIVKKCTQCGKYFITRTGNNFKCERIYKNGLTCSEYADTIRRKNYRDNSIKKLEKKVRDKLSNKPEYDFFLEENSRKKEEFYNDNKSYILWLLEYFPVEKRESIIDKLNLKSYLN